MAFTPDPFRVTLSQTGGLDAQPTSFGCNWCWRRRSGSRMRFKRRRARLSQPTHRVCCRFAAGGFADSVARIVGDHVSKTLGQPVLVENRSGAASNIAARAVASAPADGHTVLVSTTSLAINATLYKKLDYSLLDDLVPVAIAVRAPETLSVNRSKPQTLQQFIEAAKSTNLTFGSAGVGSGSHLTWFSFFKVDAKINIVHVPFRGGEPAMHAAIGGQVDGFAATASAGVVGQLTQGGLTCLAVAAAQRYAPLPNCPSLAELGYPRVDRPQNKGPIRRHGWHRAWRLARRLPDVCC